MRIKTFLWGAMAYILVVFPVAVVWHVVLFKNTYDELGYFGRKEPIFALGLLAIAVQGLVLSYAYARLYRGGNPLKEGLKFGLVAGIFLWSSHVIATAAKSDISPLAAFIAIETAYLTIQFVLVGLAIGAVYQRFRGRES